MHATYYIFFSHQMLLKLNNLKPFVKEKTLGYIFSLILNIFNADLMCMALD